MQLLFVLLEAYAAQAWWDEPHEDKVSKLKNNTVINISWNVFCFFIITNFNIAINYVSILKKFHKSELYLVLKN